MDINALIEEEVTKRVNERVKKEVNKQVNAKLAELKESLHNKIDEAFENISNQTSTYFDKTPGKCNFIQCKNYGNGSIDKFCENCVNHKAKVKSDKKPIDKTAAKLMESIKPILDLYGITENDIKVAELKLNDPEIKKNLNDMLKTLGLDTLDEI